MTALKLKIGLSSSLEKSDFECLVLGAGPAGLTAALYLARYRVDVGLIAESVGGQMSLAYLIDDYPGLPSISGEELVKRFVDHVKKYAVPLASGEKVVGVRREAERWIVETGSGNEYSGLAVILALGSQRRKLGVPGEESLVGRGVSYCATCDGPLFAGKKVAVVGGGNAAVTSALYLSSIAREVYLIHRREQFRAFPYYIEMAKSTPNIKFYTNRVVTRILGEDRVKAVELKDVSSGKTSLLELDGVFIEIGSQPPQELLRGVGLELDEEGRVIVKPDMSTNLPGIFAAGEVAGGPYKYRFDQIVTAAAEGAIAADSAYKYILMMRAKRS